MNAVEIEQAVSELAEQPFDAAEFPFAFLAAFGSKETAIKRLRSGNNNTSDVPGGVLQKPHIHLAVAAPGAVTETLRALKASPRTASNRLRFVLATDGTEFQAEDLTLGETVACDYGKFADHFGFFLPLAGITTVKQIRESAFDIRATGRLNRLYLQLLKDNPDWDKAERRPDMNHFMARLIFCFFAEDTGIFHGESLFTRTVEQMSDREGSNLHEVIGRIFTAMNTPTKHEGRPDDRHRKAANTPRWADIFPYVNGNLFSGPLEVPRFSRIARSYFLHIGGLDWKQINPDIFGSMIQAVADDEERGELGMHYTSVPNILKVLNPLFLDDLRAQLEAAGDNGRALLNLRKRMAHIRVFDPACGSGNFLVIAYKEMRAIEAEINRRRGEPDRRSAIPLTNFRGIELRDFAAEIARLALIIAEYQADVLYRGQKEALAEFLPLDSENWVTCHNALQLDWLSVCPAHGVGVRVASDDLLRTPLEQPEIDFENEGGENYICGNPPYKGRNRKGESEKEETETVFENYPGSYASLDYVGNWIIKAAEYCDITGASASFVTTNSICQGEQVALIWPLLFNKQLEITFAHTSFKWSNLASDKAGVTVVILGIGRSSKKSKYLFEGEEARVVDNIGPYLAPGPNVIVKKSEKPISTEHYMYLGNMAKDGGNLIFSLEEARKMIDTGSVPATMIRKFYGSEELIHSKPRACLWIKEAELEEANKYAAVRSRLEKVRAFRKASSAPSTQAHAGTPHRFVQISARDGKTAIIIPRVSSENRDYLPVDLMHGNPVIGDKCYAIYDAPIWNLAIVASRVHRTWIATVCSRLRTDFSYGNKIGWNTFPLPKLTLLNKADLTRCAEDILLAREAHWPATIADLYDPNDMPDDLRRAHDRNDETLERIYIGRRFRNDTERLEKLFELYTKMTGAEAKSKGAA